MKKLLIAALAILSISQANAAQKTKAQLTTEINTLLATNGQGQISASVLRQVVQDMVDSDQQINLINNQTGTSYTVSADDQGKLLTFNNAASVAVTLPAAQGSFSAGWNAIFQNLGAGVATISTTAGTINGAGSMDLQKNQIALITSVGLNAYQVVLYSPPIVYAGVTHQFVTAITSSGVVSSAQPSAADISNGVTGSGAVVLQTSPSLVTPTIGAATATSINKLAITAPATSATLTIANGKTATVNNTLTLSGTDGTTMTFPSSSAAVGALDLANQVVTGGATVASLSQATGSIVVNCGARPLQTISNAGIFTITAPANDGSCVLKTTNTASAGTITFSGFSVGANTGDTLDTTNGHKFMIFVYRVGGDSTYAVKALQ